MIDGLKKEKTIKSNKSLYFLLPTIGIMYSYYSKNILNSYISDRQYRPEINNYHIFILCKNKEDRFNNLPTFIESYNTDDGLMYVFKVPSYFEEDYLKFILGQYSQFSSKYKEQIMRLLPAPYQNSVIFKVITKSPEAKKIIEDKVGESIGDQEVFSKPSIEEEIYG